MPILNEFSDCIGINLCITTAEPLVCTIEEDNSLLCLEYLRELIPLGGAGVASLCLIVCV